MGTTAKPTRVNRTITVDFRDKATYFHLIANGKALVECVLAFVLAIGFQLKHKATCDGGGCLTRPSHYVRVRLGGVSPWLLPTTPVDSHPRRLRPGWHTKQQESMEMLGVMPPSVSPRPSCPGLDTNA